MSDPSDFGRGGRRALDAREEVQAELAKMVARKHVFGDHICYFDSDVRVVVADLLVRLIAQTEQCDAYRRAATQLHNGLVGHLNAGAFRADLAEDGARLFDEAEALQGNAHPEDIAAVASYQGRCEELEVRLIALQDDIDRLKRLLDAHGKEGLIGPQPAAASPDPAPDGSPVADPESSAKSEL